MVHEISGLYYKHITIVNDDTSIINKFEASLTHDTRVVIYDHRMFIVQATGVHSIHQSYAKFIFLWPVL